MRRFGILFLLASASVPALAAAQTAPERPPVGEPGAAQADDQSDIEEPDIIVRGQRNLPGAVIGDIPPEQQLGPADIRSYGVSSVADLLTELSPQTTSGRGSGGAPVVLLNGKRISGFAEIRDIPTEAIARVDILPEEVALKYGYRADQKVVNIVLRRRFRATTIELADRVPTAGGRNDAEGELDLLHIRGDGRLNLHLEYEAQSGLTEDERDIPGADPYRSLLASSRDFAANSVYARSIGKVSATLNGRLEYTDSNRANGLPEGVTDPAVDGVLPLQQRNSTLTTHLGTTFNGALGPKWHWSVTGNYDRSETKSFSDTDISTTGTGAAPANRAYGVSNTAGVDALFNGPLFKLPAGDISTSIKLGADTSGFDTRSYRRDRDQADLVRETLGSVSRDTVNAQINIDVPIASKSNNVLPFLGKLSANFNLAEDHLSDFGTMQTLGYGANWIPIDAIRLIVSHTDQDVAPTAQQIGNPVIITPNARVFDYVQGTTVDVTTLTGGNPNLIASNNHVTKIGLTLKPWSQTDLSLTANYVTSRTDNPITAFPAATAAIEAAFPGRIIRDPSSGQLLQLDTRPINFAESNRSQLRWGINFSKAIKSKVQKELEAFRAGTGPNPFAGLRPPGGQRRGEGGEGRPATQPDGSARNGGTPADGAAPPGAPGEGGQRAGGFGGRGPGGPGGGFGGRGGGFGGGAQGGGRLQFALYHTWHFADEVLVQDGGPRLDLLDGDAISGSGGQSRHEFEAQAGYTNNGMGVRFSGKYATGTQVNGGTPAAPEQLDFSGLGTLDVRLFADFGQRLELIKKHPWLRGTRVTLGVSNIFNSRQRVTDASGGTPVSYRPDYLDPLGRTVRLSIRKLFF
ncbi:TonB-dependent receptor [Sphingomonas sp. ZT3P38]|uniref:TonB-dependent receptor n=1 Tax=Parasphingomonas zepuensis TaxID=3096161 RepID=UPI002FC84571